MRTVFVSHASADAELVKLFTEFLKEAIGVREESIFCSTIEGHGIPLGADFNGYIKEQIQAPKVVFLLLTPSYMESAFCLMELGAAWAKSHFTLPIVVPPTDFSTVTNTLGLTQAWRITDSSKLNDLRQQMRDRLESGGLEARSDDTWDRKRVEWGARLQQALQKLKPAQKVSADAHKAVQDELVQVREQLSETQSTLAALMDEYAALEKLKDAGEVRSFKRERAGAGAPLEDFNALVQAVKDARPSNCTRVVFRYLLMDRAGNTPDIDWQSDREDFQKAVEYRLISGDHGAPVLWSSPKMRPLAEAADALIQFANGPDAGHVGEALGNAPMDPEDREFWEHHFKL